MGSRVLHIIGKGQITIPQEWRATLGMEYKAVKATLQGHRIIIETIPLEEEKTWDLEKVSINELPAADQKLIKEGRRAYKKGQKNRFLAASEFFKQ